MTQQACPEHWSLLGWTPPAHPTVTRVHAGALLSLDGGHSVYSVEPVTHVPSTHGPASCASLAPPLTLLSPEMSRLLGACLCVFEGRGCPVLGRWVDRWMRSGWTAGHARSPLQLLGATCWSRRAAGPGAGRFRVWLWPASSLTSPRILLSACPFPWPLLVCSLVVPFPVMFPLSLLGCECPWIGRPRPSPCPQPSVGRETAGLVEGVGQSQHHMDTGGPCVSVRQGPSSFPVQQTLLERPLHARG